VAYSSPGTFSAIDTGMTHSTTRIATWILLLLTTACSAENQPAITDAPPDTAAPVRPQPVVESNDSVPVPDLIDPQIPPAVAGEGGWNYSRVAIADLTGDGTPESIVLTARVEMYRGQPAWDDGQPWQVYVEAPDGHRTYLYARRLQLGTLEMRVTASDSVSSATIVLIEHLPDRLTVHEAFYSGADAVTAYTRFERALDPRGDTASPTLP
jgi:hypothetical protein